MPTTINVPAGSSHDFWLGTRSGVVDLTSQTGDFDFAAEFDAAPVVDTAHGLIVVESDYLSTGKWIRFDVYNQGSPTLFAANDQGSVYLGAALPSGHTHLRIVRSGDDFDTYSSDDGDTWTPFTSFTYALSVSDVGAWGGNFGANPAHSVEFTIAGEEVEGVTGSGTFAGAPAELAGAGTLEIVGAGTFAGGAAGLSGVALSEIVGSGTFAGAPAELYGYQEAVAAGKVRLTVEHTPGLTLEIEQL